MESKQLENLDHIKRFVLAGNSRFTLRNKETGNRVTYSVQKMDGKRGDGWFVKVLSGPSSYELVGFVWPDNGFRWWAKSKIGQAARSVKGFSWFFDQVFVQDVLPEVCEFWHEGRCCSCGRALTDPQSIASGIGPVCSGRYESSPSNFGKNPDEIFAGTAMVTASKSAPPAAKPASQNPLIDVDGLGGLSVTLDPPWINSDHSAIKNRLKSLAKAWWDPKNKRWYKISSEVLSENFDAVFGDVPVTVTASAKPLLNRDSETAKAPAKSAVPATPVSERLKKVLPEGLSLYKFQEEAVAFIEKSGGRALIGDEMGTGKSITTAAYLALHPELYPALLVVPSVVSVNWERELAKWIPNTKIHRIRTSKDEIPKDADFVVTTFDLCRRRVDELAKYGFRTVLGDEAHAFKNYKSARTKAFVKLAKTAQSVLALSGTPIINRPSEFYTLLNLLRPGSWGNWMDYTRRYCAGRYERVSYYQTVWKADGASNTAELSEKLKSVMIRRLKSEVLSQLPAKVHQNIPLQLTSSERKSYNAAIRRASGTAADQLVTINAARQWVGEYKIQAALEWISDFQELVRPLLVFAHHKNVLNGIEAGCREKGVRFGRIDGTVSTEQRGQLVEDFQDGKLDIMLLSTEAAGVGITLTRASDVLFVEASWTPASMDQAADRAHRIGQESAVVVRYLVVEDTVDSDMYELLEAKRSVLEAVLNGGASNESLDIRGDLVKRWKSASGISNKDASPTFSPAVDSGRFANL